jgi:hypothetical protein
MSLMESYVTSPVTNKVTDHIIFWKWNVNNFIKNRINAGRKKTEMWLHIYWFGLSLEIDSRWNILLLVPRGRYYISS